MYPVSLTDNKPIAGATAIQSVTGAVQTDANHVTLPSDESTATVDIEELLPWNVVDQLNHPTQVTTALAA